MDTGVAWVLNLDADLELGAPASYSPSASVERAIREHTTPLRASLLRPDDVLVDEDAPGHARGLVGRAFCPTSRALRLLERSGAAPERHPAMDVLRRVNSRAFASSLGPTLPDAAFVTSMHAVDAMLARPPSVGGAWRVKYPFGMAGRNQRALLPGPPGARDRTFLTAGLDRGGLQMEPNVVIVEEYAMHGFIDTKGNRSLGALVRQTCDQRGAWLTTERVHLDASLGRIMEAVSREAARVADALAGAGYFGPFGVDAYTYRGEGGEIALQPRSEINARYSMGFAVGFGRAPAPLR